MLNTKTRERIKANKQQRAQRYRDTKVGKIIARATQHIKEVPMQPATLREFVKEVCRELEPFCADTASTGGFRRGELPILAALTAPRKQGKTAFTANMFHGRHAPMAILEPGSIERDPMTSCFNLVDHKSRDEIVRDIRDFVTQHQADSDYWNSISAAEQVRLRASLVERVANIPKEYPPGSPGYIACFDEITARWNARFPARRIYPSYAELLERIGPAERFFKHGVISYTSLGQYYIASKNWTGFVVQCPTGGDREVICRMLLGDCVIDDVKRRVVAVESPALRDLHEGIKLGLMVEGNFCDGGDGRAKQKHEAANQ